MINYSITFATWSPEAVEIGEADDMGFISELEQDTFRCVVYLLRGTEPSCEPLPDVFPSEYVGSFLWFSEESENYRTGERTITSYHPKTPRDARYMIKAWHCANKR